MTDKHAAMSRLLHHRVKSLQKGDPLSPPIMATTTFHYPGTPDERPGYARSANPTIEAVEAQLAILEDAECVAFPSGMAAISAALCTVLKAGDTILLPSDGYYESRAFAAQILGRFGIKFRLCKTVDMATADMDGCAAVMIETPANPTLDVCDIAAVAARAKAAGAVVIADNTTLTPLLQQPLDLGVDVVVMADTKAMSGHSDVLFGHVASRDSELMARIRGWRKMSGAVPGPFEAFLVHRGLETLEVRLERMCANALAVATCLEAHPLAAHVRYPGLASSQFQDTVKTQMVSGGSVLNFTLPDEATAEAFLSDCPLLVEATSFGGVHSSGERRARWGDAVADSFIRLSAGIEPTQDLVNAISTSLDNVAS